MTMLHPIITLSNGLRICNFSSPHSFTFTDGSILPAVTEEIAKALSLDSVEEEMPNPFQRGVVDIFLKWKMSDVVALAIEDLHNYRDTFDILLVPLPVKSAIYEEIKNTAFSEKSPRRVRFEEIAFKTRSVRIADRVKKTAYIDKFCL